MISSFQHLLGLKYQKDILEEGSEIRKEVYIRQPSAGRCPGKLQNARLFLKYIQRNNDQIRTLGNRFFKFMFNDASLGNGMQILHRLW